MEQNKQSFDYNIKPEDMIRVKILEKREYVLDLMYHYLKINNKHNLAQGFDSVAIAVKILYMDIKHLMEAEKDKMEQIQTIKKIDECLTKRDLKEIIIAFELINTYLYKKGLLKVDVISKPLESAMEENLMDGFG